MLKPIHTHGFNSLTNVDVEREPPPVRLGFRAAEAETDSSMRSSSSPGAAPARGTGTAFRLSVPRQAVHVVSASTGHELLPAGGSELARRLVLSTRAELSKFLGPVRDTLGHRILATGGLPYLTQTPAGGNPKTCDAC